MVSPESVFDPFESFSGFITSLYQNKDLLNPKTITKCIEFSQKFAPPDSAYFITFQAPFFFRSHILYLQTLVSMINNNDRMWMSLKSKQVSTNAFIKFYFGFLTPVPRKAKRSAEIWKERMLLSYIIYQLLFDTVKSNTDIVTMTNNFCDKEINLLPTAPHEVEVNIVRNILSITKRTATKTARDMLQARFSNLLSAIASKKDQCTFNIVFFFLIKSKQHLVSNTKIMRTVKSVGISKPSDVDNAMLMINFSGPIPVLKMLAQCGMKFKHLHRLCFMKIREIFGRYSSDVEVCEWGQTLIRRLFLFIALAHTRNKSKTRITMLCETLSLFANMHIIWCQNSVYVTASSIYSIHTVPPNFTQFFSTNGYIDPAIVANYNSFNNNNIDLKTFPFDKKGNFIFNNVKQPEKLHVSPRSVQGRKLVKGVVKKTAVASNVVKSKLPSLHASKSIKK